MEMIKKNLFRTLPHFEPVKLDKSEGKVAGDDKIQKKMQKKEPTWKYIEGIYKIFLELVNNDSIVQNNLKPRISNSFVHQYIALADSKEKKEREIHKEILYTLYVKLV